MTKLLDSHVDFDLRLLRVGGALAGSGMLLASAGTALIGFTVAKAARDWVRQLERSPSAMASDKLQQVKGASNAAMQAWRDARPAVNGASVSR
jgi:hypothetical protein